MRSGLIVPALLLAAHAAATAGIATSYRRGGETWALLAVSALPLAQASLLAMWGVWSRWPSYLRAGVVVLAATGLWAVECRVLNLRPSDGRCAAYAMALTVQMVLVGGGLVVTRRVRDHRSECRKPAGRLQFGVGYLLAWMAAIAVALGIWKLVLIRSDWSMEVVKQKLFLFGAAVGAYNAAFAVIALAGAWWGRRWYRLLAQAILAAALVCVVASSQAAVLQALFDTTGEVETVSWVIQAGFQAVYLLVTLVAIRLCGDNPTRESSHATSTCLAARPAGVPDTA